MRLPSAEIMLQAVTDLGESATLLACVGVACIYLLICNRRREAAALFCSLALAGLLIFLLKLAYMTCAALLPGHGIYSPSGHTALAVSVLLTFAILMAANVGRKWRYIPYLLILPLAAIIAFSRIRLHYHSEAEVVMGLVVAGITLLLVRLLVLRGHAIGHFSPIIMLALMMVTVYASGNLRLNAENRVQLLVEHVKVYFPFCHKA